MIKEYDFDFLEKIQQLNCKIKEFFKKWASFSNWFMLSFSGFENMNLMFLEAQSMDQNLRGSILWL